MGELLAILTPLLVVDFLNPLLLGLLVFAAATPRPVTNSVAMLIGHTLAYFAAGVAIAYGLELVTAFLVDYWNNPPPLAFILSLVLGVACFYWVLRPAKADRQPDRADWQLTPARGFYYGVAMSLFGAPFALPYIAAIDQILKAELSLGQSYVALLVYNAGYALPFVVVPLAVIVMGPRAKPFLERFNDFVIALVSKSMPWLIGLIGTWLVFDGAYYFIVGKPVI